MGRMVAMVAAVLLGPILAGGMDTPNQAPTSKPAPTACRNHALLERLTADLNLTTDQQTQVQAILDKARADAASAADPQSAHKIWEDAWASIRTGVLTDQQRTQLAQVHPQEPWRHGRPGAHGPDGIFQSLDLTPDQEARFKTIVDQARTDARNATDPRARRQIFLAAFEKIMTTVLTADQVKQLQASKAARHAGPCGKADAPATAPSQS